MTVSSRFCAFILLMSLSVVLSGYSSVDEQEHDQKVKATWLWHTDLIASEPDRILSFAKEQGVNLLYLKVDTSRKPAYYQPFMKKASEAGVKVHALGGHAKWGLEQNRSMILTLTDWVVAYNRNVAEEEKFSGIHLDIEPYLLTEWKTDQASLLRQWMGNVEAYIGRAKQDPTLEVGCDIPFWLDNTYLPDAPATSIAEWLISMHDHVTVMAYRDRAEGPNSISALVPQELGWANALGKKIVVAVDTKQSGEGDFVTFFEEGKAHMDAELAVLSSMLSVNPSYAGTAIHSYEYWQPLMD